MPGVRTTQRLATTNTNNTKTKKERGRRQTTMADQALQAKLKAMKGQFAKAKADPKVMQDGFVNLPDQKNVLALLTGCDVGESNSSGRMQIKHEWTILEGENKGETCRNYDGLDTEQGTTYALRNLRRLGVDISSLSIEELPQACEDLMKAGIKASITLKTTQKPGQDAFQNIYINQVYEHGGTVPEAVAA